MSVLCCSVPDFLIRLRRSQRDARRPQVLLDEDARVCAASDEARLSGVALGMRAAQALARCPDAALAEANMDESRAAQDALIGALTEWALPVEESAWGLAYVDMRQVEAPSQSPSAQALCADLGRRVRAELGATLQPALGWDSGKFTARAAAAQARPGSMRLVGEVDEENFLRPLPLSLLPLPGESLQRLDWLGIRTLGQFARLPAAAVRQRFGSEGVLAQAWARGKDQRPVTPTTQRPHVEAEMDFDAPASSREWIADAFRALIKPRLAAARGRMEGYRRLRARLRLLDGSSVSIERAFVTPANRWTRVREALLAALATLTLDADATSATLTLLDAGEIAPEQLRLFDFADTAASDETSELLERLTGAFAARHGEVFWKFRLGEATHPVDERRFATVQLSR